MFLNFRYLIRLLSAFIFRFRIIIILGILFGIVTFFVFRFISPIFFENKVEKIGVTGRYSVDTLPPSILRLIGSGLTKIGKDEIPEPDLASSWETPDAGKTWIFHLKSGVTWQDGKEVTSADINYDFSDLTIEKKDAKTLTFKLQSPFSPFPAIVAKPVFRKGLLGVGDYRVARISIGGNFIQELDLVKEGNKKIYKFYPSEERAKLAYKLGEVNILENVFDPKPIDSWSTAKIEREVDTQKFIAIFFNIGDKFLSEKSARQALAYAIKKDPNFDRALSPISPNSWAYNPQVKPYNFDLGRAKELLDSLPKDLKDGTNIKLVTTPLLLDEAEKAVKDWKAVGIKSHVQVSSGIPGEYAALLAIFDIPPDPDQYSLWHSTQGETNISHYQNPRIDKLLEDGRTKTDLEERKKIYLDFQRFLIEDSPAVFLYHPISYKITRK